MCTTHHSCINMFILGPQNHQISTRTHRKCKRIQAELSHSGLFNVSDTMETRISSSNLSEVDCFFFEPGTSLFISYATTNTVVLLPLTVLTLLHGVQEWWQKGSSALSHSDCLTYSLASMELLGLSGCVTCICAVYVQHPVALIIGLVLYSFTTFGETVFHTLTSVERYLAVVHPLTYLRLRNERGTRMRNVAIACAWPLSLAMASLMQDADIFIVASFCFLLLSLIIVCFCSLSVLQVLIRTGPGEQGEGKRRADQGKKKAFYTIVLILGTLLLRFAGSLAWSVYFQSKGTLNCLLLTCEVWFHLPSSLVLPLLFLHRVGKLNPLQMFRSLD